MKAIVVDRPGNPEVLQLKDIPDPEPKPGWVLIKVKAFGLNRSEMYTRQGHSGESVPFPRVLGIECVGVVLDNGGGELQKGQKVAALMGGMGRKYDGGYAEMALIPRSQVIPVQTDLTWTDFAAIPETFMTAWGSLHQSIGLEKGETLMVRGGTSSVGMAAITIAKDMGTTVLATTRNESKRDALFANGADQVIIDTDRIATKVWEFFPKGIDHVLELVGTKTLIDSMHTVKPRGVVCFTGILGNEWIIKDFYPFDIPSTVRLTSYSSSTITSRAVDALQRVIHMAEEGRYRLNLDRIFKMEEIVEAHRYMEEGRATGKLVVVVE